MPSGSPNWSATQRLLETANIKLASVVSDVLGASGRDMLRALIEGTASAEEMAELARGQLRRKRAELTLALNGRMSEVQRFLLAVQLRRLETIEQDIELLEQQFAEKLPPYENELALLMQIPGVDWVIAATLIAEIGTDMSVFLSAHHLAAWAGVCPGNHETGGKRRSMHARKGNIHLRTALVGRRSARPGPMSAARCWRKIIRKTAYGSSDVRLISSIEGSFSD